MKANELRIGNYVNTKNGIKKVSDIGIDYDCFFTQDHVKPIPLKEEWLLKFGFVWKNHGLRKDYFCIREYGGGYAFFLSNESFNFKIELNNVHQLQNIYFALTNNELTL